VVWVLGKDSLIADDGFHAHDPLRQRRRRNQKCPGNLLCGQAADFAQRQSNLSFRWRRGMAAGKDEAEAIILDLLFLTCFADAGLKLKS
jgi:hypothetical protein